MELFLVTVDASGCSYGIELYALGIFSDKESANAVKFAYEAAHPDQSVSIDKMVLNEELSDPKWVYLGEYIE